MRAGRAIAVMMIGFATVAVVARSQATPPAAGHRIVVEVTTGDPGQWPRAVEMVANLRRAMGPDGTRVEVVCHMPSLRMLLKANGDGLGGPMATLARSGVTFAACENSMRNLHVDRADIYPFAVTVDSGAAEVVRKQEASWSYLKFGI